MKKLVPILALMALPVTTHAQERAAGSSLETQMTWTALSAKADAALTHSQAVDAKVEQIIKCNGKQKIYSPTTTGKDANGCIDIVATSGDISNISNTLTTVIKCNNAGQLYSNGKCAPVNSLANLKTQVVSASICEDARKGNSGTADTYKAVERWHVYTKKISCPQNWTLLGCSGGPGDTAESGEGSYIRPIDNGCELVIGEPICTDRLYWTKSWVFAHCAKIE